jgi:DNA-binding Xre family transcriptional regulator
MDNEFYERLSLAIQRSGKSSRQLTKETGISRQKIDKLRSQNGGMLYAHELPAMCSALSTGFEVLLGDDFPLTANAQSMDSPVIKAWLDNVSNYLMNNTLSMVREQIGEGPDVGQVLRWYHSTGGMLAEHEQLNPYLSVFEVPETPDAPLVALQVGDKCLAKTSLNTDSPEEVTEYAASMNPAARLEITESYHIAATTERWIGTSREVDVKFRTVAEPFVLIYDIFIFPRWMPGGKKVLLNFSKVSSVRPMRLITDRETRLGTSNSIQLSDRTLIETK